MEESEEKKEEIKESPKNHFDITEKVRGNPWILATFVCGVLAMVLLFVTLSGGITGNAISEDKIGELALNFFNNKLSSTTGTLNSVKESSGLYEVDLDVQGEVVPLYFTKDGKFIQQGYELISLESTSSSSTEQEEIPKSDKPVVQLFVMSFCPYGVKAENNIFSIVNLFKDKIDFKIRYIVNVNGDTIDKVSSLHGINEAKEDARQLVIRKYYPNKFYNYLKEIDNNCSSVSSDATKLDACWKNAANKLGIDVNKIETAAYGKEGIDLLKEEEEIAGQYDVSGSPTLIINGVQSDAIYSGTSETQSAICMAFNDVPSTECTTKLSDSSTTTSGSC